MSDVQQPMNPVSSKDVEENKLFAVLAYFGLLVLIPLLAKKDSPFAQFHAKQGVVLLIVSIIASVVSMVPIIGWALSPFIGLAIFVLFILGIVNAVQGHMKELPVIGQYASKINL